MDCLIQIEQLTALLPLIHQTRSSLPSLISSISPDSQSPLVQDLSTLYRSASTQCEQSLKLLNERLEELEPTLKEAEKSYEIDSEGIVLKEKVQRNQWEMVGDTLGARNGETARNGKAFKPTREAPTTREKLEKFMEKWETSHPRVRIRLVERQEEDTERIEMVVRGLMRVKLVLRWEDEDEGEGKTATVEIAACTSLNENNPLYRQSQFTLFQDLTNSTMNLIDKSHNRAEKRVSNLEEILTFLSNPPLPF